MVVLVLHLYYPRREFNDDTYLSLESTTPPRSLGSIAVLPTQ